MLKLKLALISVIVPVYNVAPYVRQCIDSILSQTIRNFELIIVDDGSTDGSGAICEEYTDQRIRLYHNKNQGLSEARNFGIQKAHGDYIAFIDSDDWIEPSLFETALKYIGDADILCYVKSNTLAVYDGEEALNAHINGEIGCTVWSKLFRKECFQVTIFPNRRIMEDLSTSYKLLHQASKIRCAPLFGYYHYRYRENSLSHNRTEQNVIDYWLAFKEMYDYCAGIVDEKTRNCILIRCAEAAARATAWHNELDIMMPEKWAEMAAFSREYITLKIRRQLSIHVRCGVLLSMMNISFSYWFANKLYGFRKRIDTCGKRGKNHNADY